MCSSTWLAGEETLAAEKTACFSLCRHAGPQRKTPRLWQAERGKEKDPWGRGLYEASQGNQA